MIFLETRFVWPVSEAESRLHAVLPFSDVAGALFRAIRDHRAGGFAVWKPAEGRRFFFDGRWFRWRNNVAFEIESEELPPDTQERRIIAPAPVFDILFGRPDWTEIVLSVCGTEKGALLLRKARRLVARACMRNARFPAPVFSKDEEPIAVAWLSVLLRSPEGYFLLIHSKNGWERIAVPEELEFLARKRKIESLLAILS
ncbi:MAG: hypothetical protein KM312_05400 [Hydrogenibacillus schlegelii]|uniref:Uncharacterized protein n=1 Tax=Hydrogenibacillus schlegelii TaxID=1484 RepID=A0A947D3D8_HYDSH|nr:hypothetical protein [Hydrogenibacillus schlegelii]